MINIFACTRPNRSGVGVIDNPDLFEQGYEQDDIPKSPEKNFRHDFLIVCRQKMFNFGVWRFL